MTLHKTRRARRPLAERLEVRSLMALAFEAATLPGLDRPALAIASADFNGDGVPDLVELGGGRIGPDGSASGPVAAVRIGRGGGQFADPVILDQTGFNPAAVVTGDFNGDGRVDFVVVQDQYRAAYTVQERRIVPVGPLFLPTVVDVVYPEIPSTIQFFANQGDGTFRPDAAIPVPPQPKAVAAGDLDGDGRLDLVLAGSVLRGRGDGSFEPPVALSLAPDAPINALALADLDGDGRTDLVAAVASRNDDGTLVRGRLEVRRGRGDGTFADPVALRYSDDPDASGVALVRDPTRLAVGDFNGDGVPDLAVVDEGAHLLLGAGDGTFGPGVAYDVGSDPRALVAADFDRDGKLDLAVSSESMHSVDVYRGHGDGTLEANRLLDADPEPAVYADFNGDGFIDVAVMVSGYSDSHPPNVSVRLGGSDGMFGPAKVFPLDPSRSSIFGTAGDINGDGRPDLILLSQSLNQAFSGGYGLQSLIGRGDGTFEPSSVEIVPDRRTYAIGLADMDGDGITDLLELFGPTFGTALGGVGIRLGRGDGTFATPVDQPLIIQAYSLAIGDLDGDGMPDVAIANAIGEQGQVRVLLNRSQPGSPAFAPEAAYSTGLNPLAVVIADLTGDGIADIAVANQGANTYPDYAEGAGVVLLAGVGGGRFGPASPIAAVFGLVPYSLAVADVTGDGRPDLLAPFLNTRDGTSAIVVVAAAAPGGVPGWVAAPTRVDHLSGRLRVGDFNGDGLVDLVAPGYPHGTLLLNQGGGRFFEPYRSPNRGGPLVAADLDGDGRPDLVALGSQGGPALLRNAADPGDLAFAVAGRSMAVTEGSAPAEWVVAGIDDADPLGRPGDYRAFINWGDGSAIEPGTVRAAGRGRFEVVGRHAYAGPGGYTAYVAVRNVTRGTEDGVSLSLTIAAGPPVLVDPPVVVDPPPVGFPPPPFPLPPAPVLTAALDPASDTGASASDRLTRDNRPNFIGVADPGAIIDVYVRTVDAAGRLGDYVSAARGVAGPDGVWSLRSIPLADGAYAVTVLASPPANSQTIVEVATAAQPLRIDTAGPAVARVVVGPRKGRIFVTFADSGSGIDLAGGAGQAASYRVGGARQARRSPVTGVTVIDDRTVMLTIRGGRPISPQARRALQVRAGRIADRAGNPLGTIPPDRFAPVQVAAAHPGRKVRTG